MQAPRIADTLHVADVVRRAVDDIRGFSIEKHGAPPDVDIEDRSGGARALCMPGLVEYALSELLKNAVQALVDTHGAWDLDEAPPVAICVWVSEDASAPPSVDHADAQELASGENAQAVQFWAGSGAGDCQLNIDEERIGDDSVQMGPATNAFWHVSVANRGRGLSDEEMRRMRSFFSTTTPAAEATYGYSKQHGAQYSGLGVGVPLTALYAEFMGGSVAWERRGGGGMRATLSLPLHGTNLQ